MEKYIEEIIEIVLDNVSCEHQEIEDTLHGPTFDDPTYSLEDEEAVIEKCLEILPRKPGITEEFIEKKARKLHQLVYGTLNKCDFKCHMMEKFRDQIRALFEDES